MVGVDEGVLTGLAPASAVEVGLLLPFPLPLLLQAASESASKTSRLRAMNQVFRCHKKLFIEFSLLIGFREL